MFNRPTKVPSVERTAEELSDGTRWPRLKYPEERAKFEAWYNGISDRLGQPRLDENWYSNVMRRLKAAYNAH